MTEQNSEKCGCSSGCSCKSKANTLLLNFMLLVIIILLSGIFYSLQGMMAMCPAMSKGKTAMCPFMPKNVSLPPQQ